MMYSIRKDLYMFLMIFDVEIKLALLFINDLTRIGKFDTRPQKETEKERERDEVIYTSRKLHILNENFVHRELIKFSNMAMLQKASRFCKAKSRLKDTTICAQVSSASSLLKMLIYTHFCVRRFRRM